MANAGYTRCFKSAPNRVEGPHVKPVNIDFHFQPVSGFFSSKLCLSSLSHSSSLTDLNIKSYHSYQVIDKDLLNQLKTNLKDKKNLGYAHGTTRADLQTFQELKSKYPVWAEITNSLSAADVLNQEMADFLIAIIEHTEQVFESAPIRSENDYCKRDGEEIFSQHFPNFLLLRERAQYSMHCNVEDEKSLKDMCTKVFPSHNSLTPGLMIMTCACPQKIVYGFSLMTSSESPQMIFDVIMSRFPQNYSPQIIYDNACKFKEFGLNRETRRFMQIQITCDRFHESNHTSCGKSFKSSEYIQLLGKNTQACEQVNAKLRMIASTCTFMNADMFMRAITLFLANQNISKTDR